MTLQDIKDTVISRTKLFFSLSGVPLFWVVIVVAAISVVIKYA